MHKISVSPPPNLHVENPNLHSDGTWIWSHSEVIRFMSVESHDGISALIRKDTRELGSSLWSLPYEDSMRRCHLQTRKRAFTKNPNVLAHSSQTSASRTVRNTR